MCTDFIFLVLFVVSFLITFTIINIAISMGGDYKKVIYGHDMNGTLCDGSSPETNYTAWPYPTFYNVTVCVASCEETQQLFHPNLVVPYISEPWFRFCVPKVSAYLGTSSSTVYQGVTENITSTPSGGSISIAMTTSEAAFMAFGDPYGSYAQIMSEALGDCWASYDVIVYSGFLAIIVSFVVVFLVGKVVGILVWVLLLGVAIFGVVLGYSVYSYGVNYLEYNSTMSAEEAVYCTNFGYGILALDAVFVTTMICLRQRVLIAVEVVKESSHAVLQMPLMMFFPLFPVASLIIYFAYWVYGAALLYSVQITNITDSPTEVLYWFDLSSTELMRNSNPATFKSFEFNMQMQYYAWWHFFHMLWVAQFLLYFSYLVFAGAAAEWYFSEADEKGHKIRGSGPNQLSRFPLFSSVKRTCFHHLGTVALCSLIIALIQLLRAIVKYIEHQTKGTPPNGLQEILFKVIGCCLWFLECCMDKINKNALIWVAIFGDSFATAACSSFVLLLKNVGRTGAISVVSHLIVWVAKVFVGIFTAAISFQIIATQEPYASTVGSPWMPTFVVFMIAYATGSIFMSIFSAVIDCIFICFLVDEDQNKGKKNVCIGAIAKSYQQPCTQESERRSCA